MNRLRLTALLDAASQARDRLGLPRLGMGGALMRRLAPEVTVNCRGVVMHGSAGHRGYLLPLQKADHEAFMTELFTQAVRPGMVVMDIGAHLGYYTILAARAGGSVYAFEPDPRTYPYLIRNIAANGVEDRVTPVQKAISNSRGVVRFSLHGGPAQSSLFADGGPGDRVDVEAQTADEFVDPSVQVGLMKIDVEGAELHVLGGMTRLLGSASQPVTLFVECYPYVLQAAGASAVQLVERLRDFGFTVEAIDDEQGRLQDVDPAGLDEHNEVGRLVNLYCQRPDSAVFASSS